MAAAKLLHQTKLKETRTGTVVDGVEALKGKVVGVVIAPHWQPELLLNTLSLISEDIDELKDSGKPVAFVYVATESDADWDKGFEDLSKQLPEDWLVVPLEDSATRSELIKVLRDFRYVMFSMAFLSENGEVNTKEGMEVLMKWGAEGFPYSSQRIEELKKQAAERAATQSLESLLLTADRDYVVRNDGSQVKIESLEGKVVALYFSSPGYTHMLAKCYKEIKDRNEEFEIVLVSRDKAQYEKEFKEMPWLAIPFSDTKTRKALCRHFEAEEHHQIYQIRSWVMLRGRHSPILVVLDKNGKTVNTDAMGLIYKHWADAYPFTPERMAELKAARQARQSLESLLVTGKRGFVLSNDPKLISELKSKTVGLYFPEERDFEFTCRLTSVYGKLKKQTADFEIIVVSSDPRARRSAFTWLALPDRRNLIEHFEVIPDPSRAVLIILGPDGKTVTKNGRSLVMKYGVKAYPFTDEHISRLEEKLTVDMANLPKEVKHPSHPEHLLVLVRDAYRGGSYGCDICEEDGSGWVYHCAACSFYAHPFCAPPESSEPQTAKDLFRRHLHSADNQAATQGLVSQDLSLEDPKLEKLDVGGCDASSSGTASAMPAEWYGRSDFNASSSSSLLRCVILIQAHVRGHQARKKYKFVRCKRIPDSDSFVFDSREDMAAFCLIGIDHGIAKFEDGCVEIRQVSPIDHANFLKNSKEVYLAFSRGPSGGQGQREHAEAGQGYKQWVMIEQKVLSQQGPGNLGNPEEGQGSGKRGNRRHGRSSGNRGNVRRGQSSGDRRHGQSSGNRGSSGQSSRGTGQGSRQEESDEGPGDSGDDSSSPLTEDDTMKVRLQCSCSAGEHVNDGPLSLAKEKSSSAAITGVLEFEFIRQWDTLSCKLDLLGRFLLDGTVHKDAQGVRYGPLHDELLVQFHPIEEDNNQVLEGTTSNSETQSVTTKMSSHSDKSWEGSGGLSIGPLKLARAQVALKYQRLWGKNEEYGSSYDLPTFGTFSVRDVSDWGRGLMHFEAVHENLRLRSDRDGDFLNLLGCVTTRLPGSFGLGLPVNLRGTGRYAMYGTEARTYQLTMQRWLGEYDSAEEKMKYGEQKYCLRLSVDYSMTVQDFERFPGKRLILNQHTPPDETAPVFRIPYRMDQNVGGTSSSIDDHQEVNLKTISNTG